MIQLIDVKPVNAAYECCITNCIIVSKCKQCNSVHCKSVKKNLASPYIHQVCVPCISAVTLRVVRFRL